MKALHSCNRALRAKPASHAALAACAQTAQPAPRRRRRLLTLPSMTSQQSLSLMCSWHSASVMVLGAMAAGQVDEPAAPPGRRRARGDCERQRWRRSGGRRRVGQAGGGALPDMRIDLIASRRAREEEQRPAETA